jgi:hypothetical protein
LPLPVSAACAQQKVAAAAAAPATLHLLLQESMCSHVLQQSMSAGQCILHGVWGFSNLSLDCELDITAHLHPAARIASAAQLLQWCIKHWRVLLGRCIVQTCSSGNMYPAGIASHSSAAQQSKLLPLPARVMLHHVTLC